MGQGKPNRTLEASEFILNDNAGKARAKLYMHPSGPRLSLFDSTGGEAVILMQGNSGGALLMQQQPHGAFAEVQLLLTPDGPTLHLIGKKTKGLMTLTNTPPGPQITILDSDKYQSTFGVAGIEFPQTGTQQTTSAASITLFGKDQSVIWRAP
jgi:hypothetical protein